MAENWDDLSDDERAAIERRRRERDVVRATPESKGGGASIGRAMALLLAGGGFLVTWVAFAVAAMSTDACMGGSIQWRCSSNASSALEWAPWLAWLSGVVLMFAGRRSLGWGLANSLAVVMYVVTVVTAFVVLAPR